MRISKVKETLPTCDENHKCSKNGITINLTPSPAATPFDSCPIGVSADLCPAGAPCLRE